MRTRSLFIRRLVAATAVGLLLAPSSHAAFWAVSRAISRADRLVEKGIAAEEDGRRKEAFDFFDQAISRYADIRRDHPDAEPEYIESRMAECRDHMLRQFTEAEAATHPSDILDPIPVAETSPDKLPQNEVTTILSQPGPADGTATTTPSRDAEAAATLPTDTDGSSDPGDAMPTAIEDGVPWLIARGRAADAVILMDKVVGGDAGAAPLVHRLLLARALLAAGNTVRAIDLLDAMMQDFPGDPAVLTLTAGANLAHGNAFSAMKALDDLVREHPRFADAYVDFAYTRFAMDPVANRDEAVIYYRNALALGAARDLRLERELGITVAP